MTTSLGRVIPVGVEAGIVLPSTSAQIKCDLWNARWILITILDPTSLVSGAPLGIMENLQLDRQTEVEATGARILAQIKALETNERTLALLNNSGLRSPITVLWGNQEVVQIHGRHKHTGTGEQGLRSSSMKTDLCGQIPGGEMMCHDKRAFLPHAMTNGRTMKHSTPPSSNEAARHLFEELRGTRTLEGGSQTAKPPQSKPRTNGGESRAPLKRRKSRAPTATTQQRGSREVSERRSHFWSRCSPTANRRPCRQDPQRSCTCSPSRSPCWRKTAEPTKRLLGPQSMRRTLEEVLPEGENRFAQITLRTRQGPPKTQNARRKHSPLTRTRHHWKTFFFLWFFRFPHTRIRVCRETQSICYISLSFVLKLGGDRKSVV